MDKALQYLSKYLAEPTILPSVRAMDPLMSELPEWWGKALVANTDGKIRQTLQAWEAYRPQMPSVFSFLSAHLRNISLLTDKNLLTGKTTVRLLYELENDGRTVYYAGGNPLAKSMTAPVRDAWSKLPADFTQFYDLLHNGWYYVASNSMGPSPTDDFLILGDMEWGILEDIGNPGCDLNDLLAVYTNGMGGYVALSIEQKGAYGDVLWWKDRSPRLNVDAWQVMDAWTEIGLSK